VKSFSIAILTAGLLAVAAAVGLAGPTQAGDRAGSCPTDLSSFADPWLLVGFEDPDKRLADRNGDGSVCVARIVVRGRVLATVLTDNAIGNPNIIPPGPCTDPFVTVAIYNPGIFPWLREVDANGDGTLCGTASLEARGLIIVLLDNPNAR